MSPALLAILILHSQAQKPVDVQKVIQGRYDSWSKAYMTNDVDTLLSILAPDYTLKTADSVLIKRPEYEATLRLRKASNSDTKKYATKILKFKLAGETAEVESRESMTSEDTDAKTGKSETVIHDHDYWDTWIRSAAIWLLERTVTEKERTRVRLGMPKVTITRILRNSGNHRALYFGLDRFSGSVNVWIRNMFPRAQCSAKSGCASAGLPDGQEGRLFLLLP